MIKFNLPRDIESQLKFFGYFTWKDLLRIGTPVLTAFLLGYQPGNFTSTVTALVMGTGVGILLYLFRYEELHLDELVYHGLRYQYQRQVEERKQSVNFHDTYAVTSNGAAVGVVKVQPLPLKMKTDAEQKAVHSTLQELYETVTFPIEIHSRQIPLSLDAYIQQLENKENGLESYTEFCQNLNDHQTNTTHHYVIIKTWRNNLTGFEEALAQLRDQYPRFEDLLQHFEPVLPFNPGELSPSKSPPVGELQQRVDIVTDALDRGSLEAEQLTGIELQQYINSFQQDETDVEIKPLTYTASSINYGRHRRLITISDYPSSAKLGWPVQLLNNNHDGRVDIIQRITPRNQADTIQSLEREIERLQAELNSRHTDGLLKDVSTLQQKKTDAEHMLDLATDNSAKLVDYQAYIVVHGSTPGERDSAHKYVKTRLETLLADYKHPVFQSDKAWKTESALHKDPLGESTLMPSSSAASGFPFATNNRNEGSGIIFGTSADDGAPVLLDIWNWSSHSSAILGKTGSGKSFYAKTLLLRWALTDTDLGQVIILDPKKEYGEPVESLGGDIHTLSGDADWEITSTVQSFEVEERGREGNETRLVEAVRQTYNQVSQDKERTIIVIDECHNILRREEGRQVLEQFVREARDTRTAVVMISQNADDFASNLEGRNILKNLEAVFLMHHAEVAEDVVDFFQLSETEQTTLRKLKTGTKADYSQALMKVSDRLDAKVRIEATSEEHQIINRGEDR